MFSEHECDAMDHAWSEHKDREDRCRLNVTAPSGVLIGCARDADHDGPCRTRGGIEANGAPRAPPAGGWLAMAIDPDVAAAINRGENEYRTKVLGQAVVAPHTEEQPIPTVIDARIEQLARALVALAPFVGLGNNPPAFRLDTCPGAEEAVRMAAIIDPTLTVRPSVDGNALFLLREYVTVATVYRVSLRGGA